MNEDMDAMSRRLRLVEEEHTAGPVGEASRDEVLATRRSVARFLRALHVSGHAIASWPPALVSRLAHADAVTARFLSQPERVDVDEVRGACESLQAVVKAMAAGLNHHERARLRSYELAIRVGLDELDAPLVQLHRAPEDEAPSACEHEGMRPTSLRCGLAVLEDAELAGIARRLGLSRRLRSVGDAAAARERLEQQITEVLRDDHLIGILIATLPREALELLAGLVRDELDAESIAAALAETEVAAAVGEGPRPTPPVEALSQCGLAFRRGVATRSPWVPIELCQRLDGVLRVLGV